MNILDHLVSVAEAAGRLVLNLYQTDISTTYKSDGSPLTEADLLAHRAIVEGLSRAFPHIPVLSEENHERFSPADRSSWSEYFLVDPIDGTKEFLKKTDEFTINIAHIKNGVPVSGVVVAPALQVTYYASLETGAWKKIHTDGHLKKIFSEELGPGVAPRAVISRSHVDDQTKNFLVRHNISEVVNVGSSLKFCYLAEGKADVYPRFGTTMAWDVAAGDCVFRYSGKQGPRQSPLTYNQTDLKNAGFVIGWSVHE